MTYSGVEVGILGVAFFLVLGAMAYWLHHTFMRTVELEDRLAEETSMQQKLLDSNQRLRQKLHAIHMSSKLKSFDEVQG